MQRPEFILFFGKNKYNRPRASNHKSKLLRTTAYVARVTKKTPLLKQMSSQKHWFSVYDFSRIGSEDDVSYEQGLTMYQATCSTGKQNLEHSDTSYAFSLQCCSEFRCLFSCIAWLLSPEIALPRLNKTWLQFEWFVPLCEAHLRSFRFDVRRLFFSSITFQLMFLSVGW